MRVERRDGEVMGRFRFVLGGALAFLLVVVGRDGWSWCVCVESTCWAACFERGDDCCVVLLCIRFFGLDWLRCSSSPAPSSPSEDASSRTVYSIVLRPALDFL